MGCQRFYSITFSKSVKVMIENLSHCFPVFAKIFVHLGDFSYFSRAFLYHFLYKRSKIGRRKKRGETTRRSRNYVRKGDIL